MKMLNFGKMTMTAFILGILAVGNVQAGQCSLIPNDTINIKEYEIQQLLRNGKFLQLEEILEKLHRKNLTSDGGDLLTSRMISLILIPQNENSLQMWIDQRPQSFFAQLSTGIFYFNHAAYARGYKFISETSPAQLAEMNKIDEKAVGYLQKAMQLDPHSALPQGVLLGIAAREDEAAGKNAAQWLQAANQADPKNLAARIKAVNFLSPRWGGSFELLDQMVEQAKKSLPSQSNNYLEFEVIMEKASHEEVIVKDKQKAYELYKRAKDMCENSEAAQNGIIRTYQPKNSN